MTLQDYFKKAKEEKWAMPHFNFSTADQLKAFIEVAEELKSPLMVATSEGEAKFVGYDQAVALVRSYQAQGHKIWLNADHHKTWESLKTAIDAGYDTVLVDASELPFEENISLTKKVLEYGRSRTPNMMIEGELGYLKGSSEIQKKIEINPNDFTKPEEAKRIVQETGIERLAIAFGNLHGITTEQQPHLDLDVLKNILSVIPDINIVLHGGSGLLDEEVKQAIQAGITNVHVNTELRIAYHDAMEKELAKDNESTTPYKFAGPAIEATKKLVKEKIELFGSVGKI